MNNIKVIEGDFKASSSQFALVVARWNSFVVEHLLEGAIDALKRHGITEKQMTIIRTPGAFEIPLHAKTIAETGEYAGVVAAGLVVDGDANSPLDNPEYTWTITTGDNTAPTAVELSAFQCFVRYY